SSSKQQPPLLDAHRELCRTKHNAQHRIPQISRKSLERTYWLFAIPQSHLGAQSCGEHRGVMDRKAATSSRLPLAAHCDPNHIADAAFEIQFCALRIHSRLRSAGGAVMDNVRAALLPQGEFNREALLVFTLIIAAWALARPTTIRDSDNRRLPPNLTARLIIVLLYALIYAGLVAAFVFAKPFVMKTLNVLPDQIENAFKSLEKQGPLLAVMALVGLHSLAPFR